MVNALSSREVRVIELAAQGLTDKSIANELGISASTVITYWGRIRSKLGHQSRAEIVAHFIQGQAEVASAALQESLAEREKLANELSSGIEALQSILDYAPEAILVVEPSGQITYGNDEAARLLKCNRSEFANLRIGRFIPAQFHEVHREHRRKYLEAPQRMEMGHKGWVEILDYSGDSFTGTVTINVAPSSMGGAVVVMLRSQPAT